MLSRGAQALPQLCISRQARDVCSQKTEITAWREESRYAMLHEIFHTRHIEPHDRSTVAHGVETGVGQAFTSGGHQKYVRSGVKGVRITNKAKHSHRMTRSLLKIFPGQVSLVEPSQKQFVINSLS